MSAETRPNQQDTQLRMDVEIVFIYFFNHENDLRNANFYQVGKLSELSTLSKCLEQSGDIFLRIWPGQCKYHGLVWICEKPHNLHHAQLDNFSSSSRSGVNKSSYSSSTCRVLEFNLELIKSSSSSSSSSSLGSRVQVYHNTRLELLASLIELYYLINRVDFEASRV